MFDGRAVIAINYSDFKYEQQRKCNTYSAYKRGKVDKVIEYSPVDIDSNFVERNASIFAYKRGAGLWLWKPYIILKTLELMNEGDYLFYCDSGAYYVNSVNRLIETLEREKVSMMPFEIPLLERQWTKKETFELMEYADCNDNQICTGYILMKKCDFTMFIIQEWLAYMQDERVVSPRKFTSKPDFDDFVEHRDDQSVFSIVCRKNKIIPFRDPSQFGDRPWEYAWVKSYENRWKRWLLCEKKYCNSPYHKIIVSNRGADPIKFRKKEICKSFLCKLGLYNRYYFKYKLGAFV